MLNGQDALEAVKVFLDKKHSTYKLIMLDYNMPIYTGSFTTVLIREYLRENANESLPQPYIACLTNDQDENSQENPAKHEPGIDYFIAKPVFRAGLR